MSQFVESLKRLYNNKLINKDKVCKLYKDKKINEDEMKYILENN